MQNHKTCCTPLPSAFTPQMPRERERRQNQVGNLPFLTQLCDADLLQVLPSDVGDEVNVLITVFHQDLVILCQPNHGEPESQVSLGGTEDKVCTRHSLNHIVTETTRALKSNLGAVCFLPKSMSCFHSNSSVFGLPCFGICFIEYPRYLVTRSLPACLLKLYCAILRIMHL